MNLYPGRNLSGFIPAGRNLTLDIIRGYAIMLLAACHQGFFYPLEGTARYFWQFNANLLVPMFISVSGMSAVLFEYGHGWPFRMALHGAALFSMAWGIDVLTHRSFQIDWDIFQLIGMGYLIIGLMNYLGSRLLRIGALACLIAVWWLYPAWRPDSGVYPIWPWSIYFFVGYLLAHFGKSRLNTSWITGLLTVFLIGCVVIGLSDGKVINNRAPSGGFVAMAIIFLLAVFFFALENRSLLNGGLPRLFIKFGTYPLTLYYFQQTVTRIEAKFQFRLHVTGDPDADWLIHAVLLVVPMFFYTFALDRFPILRMEWWLREVETRILGRIPEVSIFKRGYRI